MQKTPSLTHLFHRTEANIAQGQKTNRVETKITQKKRGENVTSPQTYLDATSGSRAANGTMDPKAHLPVALINFFLSVSLLKWRESQAVTCDFALTSSKERKEAD